MFSQPATFYLHVLIDLLPKYVEYSMLHVTLKIQLLDFLKFYNGIHVIL